MTVKQLAGLVGCGVLLGAAAIDAHHAVQAQFDVQKPAVTLVGALKKTEWINPHAKLTITVKNEQTGAIEDWELQMAAAEQLRREGNTLVWQATVDDPVLLRPWTMTPRTVRLNPNPNAELEEDLPCFERDLQHMVTKERG